MLKILWDRLELNVLHMLDHAIHVVPLLPDKMQGSWIDRFWHRIMGDKHRSYPSL